MMHLTLRFPKNVWKAILIRIHTNGQPQKFQVKDVMLLI